MKILSGSRGLLLVLTGVLLLLASGSRHERLIQMRRARHLQQVAPEDTTPLVAMTTVAFGGFSGLVADALWVRANKMQEEGQYFEMVQLAKWITQLEPRIPEVWSFQAWNLAYNISVLFPEDEDRWRWVNHGLDLLRQQGLTHNPNSPDLHWDIGWMFQHKIGMQFDLAHRLYKQKLREQMEPLLPGGRFDAETLAPETREALRENFAMLPEEMRRLEESFGPLDWRSTDSHVLYWSTRGLSFASKPFDLQRLRRMQMQSLAQLMRGGRVVFSEDGRSQIRLPRMELIDPVITMYEEMLTASPHNHYLRRGYVNFLSDAMMLNADYGHLDKAYPLYEKLAAVDPRIPAGMEPFKQFIQIELTRDPAELNYDQALNRITALLSQSFSAGDDPVRTRGYRQMALQLHRIYQESRESDEHRERTGLPEFEHIVDMVRKSRDL